MRDSKQQLIIKPYKKNKVKVFWFGLLALLIVVAMCACFYIGQRLGNAEIDRDASKIHDLQKSVNELQQKLGATQESLALVQRHKQVQDEAYAQLNKAYANSEKKNSLLVSELDFYRSIISPTDGKEGPAIQGFDSSFAQGKLSFNVTLVQGVRHEGQVKGVFRVLLYYDNEQGEQVVLAKWPENSAKKVIYRYFDRLSGNFELEILPKNAKIKAQLTLSNGKLIERWFDVHSDI